MVILPFFSFSSVVVKVTNQHKHGEKSFYAGEKVLAEIEIEWEGG